MKHRGSDYLKHPDRLPPAGAGFVWDVHRGTIVLRPQTENAKAVFTTRVGGLGPPPLDSLNLAWDLRKTLGRSREDLWADPDSTYPVANHDDMILANRDIVARTIGREWRASRLRQVHGADVVKAQSHNAKTVEADALWTDEPSRTVAVLTADCVPVLVANASRVAAAHAGWRGLLAGIVESTVGAVAAGGSDGAEIEVFAGPAIGPCCFEVGAEVTDGFSARFGPRTVPDDSHVDLWQAVEAAATEAGSKTVRAARVCTSCHEELFFSHRRDAGRTGRQGLLACLPDAEAVQ
ncbi:MAG TPA: peptidoglycan editing factor PgeF [Actinomycetota bacterium]|nr:peptidoglycan editing factor PgeF [Actinomycetota bacterium]